MPHTYFQLFLGVGLLLHDLLLVAAVRSRTAHYWDLPLKLEFTALNRKQPFRISIAANDRLSHQYFGANRGLRTVHKFS